MDPLPGFQIPSMYGQPTANEYDYGVPLSIPSINNTAPMAPPMVGGDFNSVSRDMNQFEGQFDDSMRPLLQEPAAKLPGPEEQSYLQMNPVPQQYGQPQQYQAHSTFSNSTNNIEISTLADQYRALKKQRRDIDDMLDKISRRLAQLGSEGHALPADIATTIGPLYRQTAPSPSQSQVTGQGLLRPSGSQVGTNASTAARNHNARYWSSEEHAMYLDAVELYGERDIKRIAMHVGTRTTTQVRTHQQKYMKKLKRIFETAKAQADAEMAAIAPRLQAYESAMASGGQVPESLWRLLGQVPESLQPPGSGNESDCSDASVKSSIGGINRDERILQLLTGGNISYYSMVYIKHCFIEFSQRSGDIDPQKARLSRIAEHMYLTVEEVRDILQYLALLDSRIIRALPSRKRRGPSVPAGSVTGSSAAPSRGPSGVSGNFGSGYRGTYM
ncbi:Myb-like DNA-binding domain [Carpediemonas membranifera]|uniref:Myb-like DNA-binding domain n=1 Tax=Carpediemonas membranifera TaxID=201153 RepID=A0A8J6DZX1_9EUKA|nr:Myb-like DNA-binding domain [Carpediemonas membranifera]|eukprot:KAG9391016.1 Myb-like DNA-binding domain [Carpediemonas membranifera]